MLIFLNHVGMHGSCVLTDCGAKLQHFEMVLEVCGGLSWKCRFNVVFCGLLLCLFGHGMPCSYIAKYTLSLCTTQQQASSNPQASKPPKLVHTVSGYLDGILTLATLATLATACRFLKKIYGLFL